MTLVMVGEVQPLVQTLKPGSQSIPIHPVSVVQIEETTIKQNQVCIHMYVIYIYTCSRFGDPLMVPPSPLWMWELGGVMLVKCMYVCMYVVYCNLM